jgi:hypothetical protein
MMISWFRAMVLTSCKTNHFGLVSTEFTSFRSGSCATPPYFLIIFTVVFEQEWRSRYSDCLRAGRPRGGLSSSPGSVKNFFHVVQIGSGAHPASYRLSTRGSFPGDKANRAWSWPLTSNYWRGQENMDLYIHSPIHLHGAVLNFFLFWIVRLLALRPLLAYCASLGW